MTSDNKKALDAYNEYKKQNPHAYQTFDRMSFEAGFNFAKAALTAQTVTDAEVRGYKEKAVDAVNSWSEWKKSMMANAAGNKSTDYLVRDLDIIKVILESSKHTVDADFQRIDRLKNFIRAATAPKNCDYKELRDMNDKLIDDCVKAKKERDALVKALEEIAHPSNNYYCRNVAIKALAAHRAQEGE